MEHKWENAFTIDKTSWGFNRLATIDQYLTVSELIHTIVEVVAFNGNALLNIGPCADGTISPIFVDRLVGIGEWMEDGGAKVFQVQPLRFLITGTTIGKIRVVFKLVNHVYDERHNSRIAGMCKPLREFPKPTEFEVEIYCNQGMLFQTQDQYDNCGCRKTNGCRDCRGYDVEGLVDYNSDDNEEEEDGDDKWEQDNQIKKANLKIAVTAILMCAKRIAEQDGPSVAYLIDQLPEALQAYLPQDFDRSGPLEDRATIVEWKYQAAKTVEEWWAQILDGPKICDLDPFEFELDELPWYRANYYESSDYDSSDSDSE